MAISLEQRGSIFLVAVVCLLIIGICAPFGGHDLQRVMQVTIGVCAVLYGLSFSRAEQLVDRPTALGLALVVALGLVSSMLARQPLWALVEVAVFVSCGAIAMAFALLRRQGGEPLDRALILVVVLLCLIKSIQYLHAGALAFTSAVRTLDPDVLLSGFSNKRFYGQFQTFTLPLLALPLLIPALSRSLKGAVFVLLCVWWMIAIGGGTRGTWLGMGAAGVVVSVLGPWGRRWLGCRGAGAGWVGSWPQCWVACCCIGCCLRCWRITWGSRSSMTPVIASPRACRGAVRSGGRRGICLSSDRGWVSGRCILPISPMKLPHTRTRPSCNGPVNGVCPRRCALRFWHGEAGGPPSAYCVNVGSAPSVPT